MRGSGDLLRALASIRSRRCAALGLLLIAALLLPVASPAQTETATEATQDDEPGELTADEDTENREADAGEESSAKDEPEDFSSEDDERGRFGIEPITASDIEEILIQGEAGAGIPKAAPISVIGFDMDTLSKEGIKDIRDLPNFTPTLEIKSQFGATNPAIFIRGVGLDDFNANSVSAVAIYQDGVYMQSSAIQLFGFFDEETVDVLRGPQGTFYRNASAGAILVKSVPPSDEFEAYISSSYGSYDQFDAIAVINGPIVPDWLSARLAGTFNSRAGIVKNRCGQLQLKRRPCLASQSPLFEIERVPENVNSVENYGARLQFLLAPPTADMEFLLNFHGGQNLAPALQYQHHAIHLLEERVDITNPEPAEVQVPIYPPYQPGDFTGYRDLDDDSFAGEYDLNGPEDLDIFGTNLRYTWRFGDAYEFMSLTAYEWHDRYTQENSDGSPRFALVTEYSDDAWQFSEELKLTGEWIGTDIGDGGWRAGALYLQQDLNVENIFRIVNGEDLNQTYTELLRNFGSYVQADYTIRPGCHPIGCDIKLDVGLRYNVEYKKFDISTCTFSVGNCGPFAATIKGKEIETWDGWSGDFILSWYFDDEESNVYLKYSRGWKGGHFNGGATTRFDIITGVEPEVVDSYELGLRAHWFDGRLMTNVTGFYYDYKDLQVFKIEQTALQGFPIFKLVNAQSATVRGVEIDLLAQPTEGMEINFSFAWVDSKYDEFTTSLPFRFAMERPQGGRFPETVIRREFSYTGNELLASPTYSFTGSIRYDIPLPGEISGHGLGTLSPRYSFSWKDDVYFDPAEGQGAYINFPVATFGQEAFWIHNASLSWRSEDETIEITGWVHNFLNQFYKTSSDDLSVGLNFLLHSWADPRTYGITATISF